MCVSRRVIRSQTLQRWEVPDFDGKCRNFRLNAGWKMVSLSVENVLQIQKKMCLSIRIDQHFTLHE